MKIAVIDTKDITLTLANKAIKANGQNIPFRLIDFLILNHKTMLNTADILTLTKENISILLVAHNNSNFSIIHSANALHSELKHAQYQALKNQLPIAKHFIEKKLQSHQEHLKTMQIQNSSHALEELTKATTIENIMGIEGAYAKHYFEHYFSKISKELHHHKRSKQPPKDPVNALLSYWYSLYYYIIVRHLISHGFEPSIGYLHKPFRTHYALASDVLEIFRASINQAVLSIFNHSLLTKEDFSFNKGVYLKFEGRKKVWSEFLALVDILNPQLKNEITLLKKMIYATAI